MDKTKREMLDKLRQLCSEAQKRFHAQIKGIFGSYARGEQHSDSDLDVLVEFAAEADLFDFVGLSNFLEEKLNRKIDVVPFGSVRDEIKSDILKETDYL